MNMHACGQLNGHNYLVSRISKTCDKHNVSFLKYVFNENYASHVRKKHVAHVSRWPERQR